WLAVWKHSEKAVVHGVPHKCRVGRKRQHGHRQSVFTRACAFASNWRCNTTCKVDELQRIVASVGDNYASIAQFTESTNPGKWFVKSRSGCGECTRRYWLRANGACRNAQEHGIADDVFHGGVGAGER